MLSVAASRSLAYSFVHVAFECSCPHFTSAFGSRTGSPPQSDLIVAVVPAGQDTPDIIENSTVDCHRQAVRAVPLHRGCGRGLLWSEVGGLQPCREGQRGDSGAEVGCPKDPGGLYSASAMAPERVVGGRWSGVRVMGDRVRWMPARTAMGQHLCLHACAKVTGECGGG